MKTKLSKVVEVPLRLRAAVAGLVGAFVLGAFDVPAAFARNESFFVAPGESSSGGGKNGASREALACLGTIEVSDETPELKFRHAESSWPHPAINDITSTVRLRASGAIQEMTLPLGGDLVMAGGLGLFDKILRGPARADVEYQVESRIRWSPRGTSDIEEAGVRENSWRKKTNNSLCVPQLVEMIPLRVPLASAKESLGISRLAYLLVEYELAGSSVKYLVELGDLKPDAEQLVETDLLVPAQQPLDFSYALVYLTKKGDRKLSRRERRTYRPKANLEPLALTESMLVD